MPFQIELWMILIACVAVLFMFLLGFAALLKKCYTKWLTNFSKTYLHLIYNLFHNSMIVTWKMKLVGCTNLCSKSI